MQTYFKKMLTQTQEDYLRAIYLLQSELDRPIKSVELVEKMQLTKSTVSQRLKELQAKGWITQGKYQPIEMTDSGRKLAENLTYKHRIIEMFLLEKLGLSAREVHQEAHQLEHACSEKVILKIAKMLGNPKNCPHGQPLPSFNKGLES